MRAVVITGTSTGIGRACALTLDRMGLQVFAGPRTEAANGSAPQVVARAVAHALTSRRPRVRYPVGTGARRLLTLRRVLPDRWMDRIFGHATGYSAGTR